MAPPAPAATTAPAAAPLVTTSSTASAASAVAPSGPVAGTLKFGAAVSLTGANSNEGKLTQDGYNFWKKTVNDAGGMAVGTQRYMVDIKFYDDESSPDTSAKLDRETDHR